jgi:hypothetical protein
MCFLKCAAYLGSDDLFHFHCSGSTARAKTPAPTLLTGEDGPFSIYHASRRRTVFSTVDQALERGSIRSKWPAVETSV